MSDLLTFFVDLIESSFGIIAVFGILLVIALFIVNKLIIEKWINSYLWQRFIVIILISFIFIIYGIGSWYPSFLFVVPLWSETLNDNVLSILDGILVLTYGLVINYRLQVQKVETSLSNPIIFIFIMFIIVGIVQVVLEDFLMLPIAFAVIGFIVILMGKFLNQKVMYIGWISIITGISGFIFMTIFGDEIGKSSIITSLVISIIGIATIKARKKSSMNVYCKNNPNSNLCKIK